MATKKENLSYTKGAYGRRTTHRGMATKEQRYNKNRKRIPVGELPIGEWRRPLPEEGGVDDL